MALSSPSAQPIVRPHLVARLEEGMQYPVTLVLAPAGYGKSTLLRTWAAITHRPVAWVCLEEADRDPSHCLSRLVGALQQVLPGLGAEVLAGLPLASAALLPGALAGLLGELDRAPQEIALVFDECQAIAPSPLSAAAGDLLDFVPPQLHLVIACRAEPDLPLARLRVRRRLVEIGPADLSLTGAEAAALLQQRLGIGLPPSWAAALHERTEGWAMGLQLAVLALQGSSDPAGLVRGFSGAGAELADYFRRQVLAPQPETVRSFLRLTCGLEQLTVPLCNAATGQQDAAAMLGRLERAGLFTFAVDEQRRAYRYHQLFAEFLQSAV